MGPAFNSKMSAFTNDYVPVELNLYYHYRLGILLLLSKLPQFIERWWRMKVGRIRQRSSLKTFVVSR